MKFTQIQIAFQTKLDGVIDRGQVSNNSTFHGHSDNVDGNVITSGEQPISHRYFDAYKLGANSNPNDDNSHAHTLYSINGSTLKMYGNAKFNVNVMPIIQVQSDQDTITLIANSGYDRDSYDASKGIYYSVVNSSMKGDSPQEISYAESYTVVFPVKSKDYNEHTKSGGRDFGYVSDHVVPDIIVGPEASVNFIDDLSLNDYLSLSENIKNGDLSGLEIENQPKDYDPNQPIVIVRSGYDREIEFQGRKDKEYDIDVLVETYAPVGNGKYEIVSIHNYKYLEINSGEKLPGVIRREYGGSEPTMAEVMAMSDQDKIEYLEDNTMPSARVLSTTQDVKKLREGNSRDDILLSYMISTENFSNNRHSEFKQILEIGRYIELGENYDLKDYLTNLKAGTQSNVKPDGKGIEDFEKQGLKTITSQILKGGELDFEGDGDVVLITSSNNKYIYNSDMNRFQPESAFEKK